MPVSERTALLRWFDAHARDLPWRRTRDPYAIWVSEIMLQQTRVETVLRYYERFLARFPDASTLATASEDEVLAAWSGLGYYRRARLLHRGAKELVARHDGRMPEDRDARLALPGIGRYTAGAIGSIAFDRPEPLVDGNVARVLARLRGIDTPLDARETEVALWAEAEALVAGARPGILNQALMELGATVCTPTAPRCEDCPVARGCVARATERTSLLPVPKARRAPRPVDLVALVVTDATGAIAMIRSDEALFGGLWGVPMREGRSVATARALAADHGLPPPGARPLARVEHVLTHRRLSVRVFHSPLAATTPTRLVHPRELGSSVGVSTLTRKILAPVLSELTAGTLR